MIDALPVIVKSRNFKLLSTSTAIVRFLIKISVVDRINSIQYLVVQYKPGNIRHILNYTDEKCQHNRDLIFKIFIKLI